jgi:hypothetical protein
MALWSPQLQGGEGRLARWCGFSPLRWKEAVDLLALGLCYPLVTCLGVHPHLLHRGLVVLLHCSRNPAGLPKVSASIFSLWAEGIGKALLASPHSWGTVPVLPAGPPGLHLLVLLATCDWLHVPAPCGGQRLGDPGVP